jgi:tRNA nucleotidyltransferase (CCA-adding enzyme)
MKNEWSSEHARWEHFPHVADVGVRGFGPTLESAFEQAALALTAAVTEGEVKPAVRVEIDCVAPDFELLFVDWLNAIIYEMAVRRMLFGRFEVHIDGKALRASAWGEPADRSRHAPACEPKGATYTALRVEQLPEGGWAAGCVVDV